MEMELRGLVKELLCCETCTGAHTRGYTVKNFGFGQATKLRAS